MTINLIPHHLRSPKRDAAFWARIDVLDSNNCWLWKIETQLTQGGFGAAFYASIHTTAHRIAFMLIKGPIPEGANVLHTCADRYPKGSRVNRRCCNPWHLYPGSDQDNSDDMVRQERWQRQTSYVGDANPNARISADRLPEFFCDSETMSQRQMAAKYCISKSQVANILNGTSRSEAICSLPEEQRTAIQLANERRRKNR